MSTSDEQIAKLEAKSRIQGAMLKIEMAQNLLEEACQEICSVQGAHPEWKLIGGLYDKVKSSWYALETKMRSGVCKLDPGALAHFKEKNNIK